LCNGSGDGVAGVVVRCGGGDSVKGVIGVAWVRRWIYCGGFVGDSFWRLPLLFGSIIVFACSCLSFGLLRCFKVC